MESNLLTCNGQYNIRVDAKHLEILYLFTH